MTNDILVWGDFTFGTLITRLPDITKKGKKWVQMVVELSPATYKRFGIDMRIWGCDRWGKVSPGSTYFLFECDRDDLVTPTPLEDGREGFFILKSLDLQPTNLSTYNLELQARNDLLRRENMVLTETNRKLQFLMEDYSKMHLSTLQHMKEMQDTVATPSPEPDEEADEKVNQDGS